MGLLQVGLGSGVALGPLLGGLMADAFGYAAAFYSTAALLFCAGVIVWRGVEEDARPSAARGGRPAGFRDGWRHVLTAPGVGITYGLRFLCQLGRMMIVPVAPLFIQTLLVDAERLNTFTGLVIGAASAATTFSAVALGRLGDRVGQQRILTISALLAGLLYLPQGLVTAGWQLLILQALVGVALGGIIPAISALLARYTQVGEEGAVYGLDNSIDAAGRMVAPMMGAGVALWFGLRATFAATALIFLAMGLLAARRLPRRGSAWSSS